MPPAQRAKIEASMRAQAGQVTTAHHLRSCVTRQDLDRGELTGREERELHPQGDFTVRAAPRVRGDLHGPRALEIPLQGRCAVHERYTGSIDMEHATARCTST